MDQDGLILMSSRNGFVLLVESKDVDDPYSVTSDENRNVLEGDNLLAWYFFFDCHFERSWFRMRCGTLRTWRVCYKHLTACSS
jgi:hypothetical protein